MLSFEKLSIKLIVVIITIKLMSERMGCKGNEFYRSSLDEEESA